jgi:Kef-type K+ transport system membrane component KefB
MGLPAMVGGVVGGVLLGPSALDILRVSSEIEGISQLGLFLLLLLAAMETKTEDLLAAIRGKNLWTTSLGFTAPLLCGMAVGAVFRMGVPLTVFLGLCAALGAVPAGLDGTGTEPGRRIVSASAADGTAVLLLLGAALPLGGSSAWGRFAASSGLTVLKSVLLMAAAAGACRLLKRLTAGMPESLKGKETVFAAVLLFVMIFASLCEACGLHFAAGAFFGALLLGRGLLGRPGVEEVRRTASGIAMGFLAPIFFAAVGLRFNAGSLCDWPLAAAVLAAPFAGKTLGGFCGGRLAGLSKDESWALGLGLNGRGLLELAAADLALSNGLIGPDLFSMLVLMVVLTAAATPFLLKEAFRRSEA